MQFLVSWTTPGTRKVEQLLRKLSFFLPLRQGNTGLQCEKPVQLCLTGSLASPNGNTTPLCCLHGFNHGFMQVTALVNSPLFCYFKYVLYLSLWSDAYIAKRYSRLYKTHFGEPTALCYLQ